YRFSYSTPQHPDNLFVITESKVEFCTSVVKPEFLNRSDLDDISVDQSCLRLYIYTRLEDELSLLSEMFPEYCSITEERTEPVIFDIVDFCREFIAKNIPSVECAICLTGFTDESEVYMTAEHHYFHKRCIGVYMAQREIDFRQESEELLSKDPYYQSPGLRVRITSWSLWFIPLF
ncbi:putative Rnf25 protein, partial [Fasciolopsis buskii]